MLCTVCKLQKIGTFCFKHLLLLAFLMKEESKGKV